MTVHHLCSFSSAAGELSAKEIKNERVLLQTILEHPLVSTFDMDKKGLWKAITKLKVSGLLNELEEPYPWHRFEVTDAGKEFLDWTKKVHGSLEDAE